MKKLLLIIFALCFSLCACEAFAASTGEVTFRVGPDEEYTSIPDVLAAAEDYYTDEDDEDPETLTVIRIILADDITDDFDTLLLDENSSLTQLTIQGDGHTIYSPSAQRHIVLNNSALTLIINSVTLAGNEDDGGGGIWLQNGTITASSVRFTGNDAGALTDDELDTTGGAFHISGSTAAATLTSCTFTSNSSSIGGAVHAEAGKLTISSGSFSSNGQATDYSDMAEYGGAIYISSGAAVTLSGTPSFTGNTASISGGAVYSVNALNITGGTFSANNAGTYGGAVYTANSTLTITGGTFTGNNAGISGGAIHNESSTLTISGAAFNNSTAANTALYGGAVYSSGGSASISSTTFSGNTSADCGGAVYAVGAVSFGEGVTFSGNHANNGGAIYISADAAVSAASSVTFTSNSAANGGALWAYSGTATDGLTAPLTFSNNTADYGGAVYIYAKSSQLTLDSSKPWAFSGNTANYDGGAVFTRSADVFINGIEISGGNNTALQGGGFLRSGGTTTITDAAVSGQNAHFGGAVYSVGNVIITNSTFSGNTATASSGTINGGGGAVYVQGSITVSSSDFSNNNNTSTFANHGGGAVFVSGDAVIDGSVFTGNIHQNSAANNTNGGGAVYVHGTLTITASQFTSNSAAGSSLSRGGAIYADSSNIAITNCLFQNNKSVHNGGAVVFAGECSSTIEQSSFTENVSSGGYGGAVYAQGNFSVKNSYFYLNRAYAYGGAVYFNQHNNTSYGSFTAEVCYFAQNSAGIAPSQNGFGGALYVSPETATINRCTFDSNQVSSSNGQSYGGGVYLDLSDSISAAVSTIKNSVFFANNAADGAGNYGAGIYTKGDVSIISCNIADNSASGSESRGGGVYADTGTTTITASIIVGNTGNIGRDVYANGTITSRGYNRIGVYGKGGSNTSWLADVSGSGTDRENSSWTTATFFGSNAALVTSYGSYTIPTVGDSSNPVPLPALLLNEDENLALSDRASNQIPFARRFTLNVEQYDLWGLNRYANGTDITIGATISGSEGGSSSGGGEGSFDIAGIVMSGIPNNLRYPGQTASLIALIRYTNGRTAYGVPANTTNITVNQQERVIWSSSNSNAVKVDQNGNVTALRATSNTEGVTISVQTVRNTLAGTPATASVKIFISDSTGYSYMNISPEYYNYLTQNVYPRLFEYDISAAIADINPSTVRSATFRNNFSKIWTALTPTQITDLTSSAPDISASTSVPAVEGMKAVKSAGVNINYTNRSAGELLALTYSWTLKDTDLPAGITLPTGTSIPASFVEEFFSKCLIAYSGNKQVIPVVGGSGISGLEAYEGEMLKVSHADSGSGLHVELTVYVGNLPVTGAYDGAQIVSSSGMAKAFVVPDGVSDNAISGSMWMFQPAGSDSSTTPGTTPGTSTPVTSGGSGGGGGCDSIGLGLLGAVILFLKRRQ